jgi:hypothetical protein
MPSSRPVPAGIKFQECLWIRSGIMDQSSIFRSLCKALVERGVSILTLKGPDDREGLEQIRKTVWSSDRHVVFDGIMPHEARRLYPIFKERRNFSMSMVDWWTSPHWFTRNAHYLVFRNYNGIALRRGLGAFGAGWRPPLLAWPERMNAFAVASCLLRGPALLAAPALELLHQRQRAMEDIPVNRLLYFPFTIDAGQVPVNTVAARYDFCNVSANGGYWFMRDPHASSWLNFANLYYDRLRLADFLSRPNSPYKFFDLRRSPYLKWPEYMQVVQGSRFAIATGGLHQNSVAKYVEFACLGTPMIGSDIPFEYPWLTQCLHPIEAATATPENLSRQLSEALARQTQLRENCLGVRDSLLKLYHPHRVLDLLQEQADGQPIPPGYLKPAACLDASN